MISLFIILSLDKVFIARRKREKSMGGYFEFPGGKIEEGEDPKDALVRELKEELGMEVNVNTFFGTNIHQYEKFTIELIAYDCEFDSATYELTDHDKWEFVLPIEFDTFNMAAADILWLRLFKRN